MPQTSYPILETTRGVCNCKCSLKLVVTVAFAFILLFEVFEDKHDPFTPTPVGFLSLQNPLDNHKLFHYDVIVKPYTLKKTNLTELAIRQNTWAFQKRTTATKIDSEDINTILSSLPSITSVCVVLSNAVGFHSEVQVAIHSYLIANNFPVCYYDYLDPKLGYTEWFQPPKSSSFYLSPHMPIPEIFFEFEERAYNRTNRNHHIRQPFIFATSPPEHIFPFASHLRNPPHKGPLVRNHPGAVVIVHEIVSELEQRRVRVHDALSANWTLAFLSPQVEHTWRSGLLVKSSNHNLAQDAGSIAATASDFTQRFANRTISFVPVWQNPTTIPGASASPFIRLSAAPESEIERHIGYVNWKYAFEVSDSQFQNVIDKGHLVKTTMDTIKTWKYIVVQGTPLKQRRDYETLFRWASISETLTNTPNAKLVLVGRLWGDFRKHIPMDLLHKHPILTSKILFFPFVTHIQLSNIIEHSRGVYTSLYANDWTYVDFKCSGTVPTTLSQAIPILGDSRIGMAYGPIVANGVVEFRNPDIRAKTLNGRHVLPLPQLPDSNNPALAPPLPRSLNFTDFTHENKFVADTPGVIAAHDTFEDAFRWLVTLEDSKFLEVRKNVLAARDTLFDQNVRLFKDLCLKQTLM